MKVLLLLVGILLHGPPWVTALQVFEGDPFVLLPCKLSSVDLKNATVVWSRSDLSPSTVHQRGPEGDELMGQNRLYRSRTSMRADALETGDLSLNVTRLKPSDAGNYTCSRDGAVLRRVQLEVEEPFPAWARVLLCALVVLVLVASGGIFGYFRHNFPTGPTVKVEENSGVKYVLLPCHSTVQPLGDVTVEWTDSHGNKVHIVDRDHHSRPEKQIRFYRNRTKMNNEQQRTGDLSLVLEHPTRADSDTYTCWVYSRRRRVLMKKQVQLQVKVQQVEVDSGVDAVLLPCQTTVQLLASTVEWKNSENWTVHKLQGSSDPLSQQEKIYKSRTEMNKDFLQTGDLSLTLKHPTFEDRDIYTCTVYSTDGDVLMKKQVQLHVRDGQVEVKEGAESVLLPFKVPPELLQQAKVVWWRYEPGPVKKVLVYKNGCNRHFEPDQSHRSRSKMNGELLKTGDLSLTLSRPTNTERYRCGVWRNGQLLIWTTVLLTVRGRVQLQEEPEDQRDRSCSMDLTPLMAGQPDY
ncbi:uncharacterized protein LOC105923477 [Fundulus heteroclitus]|uniref:uncharacterized protein LOC105923477 n=1 Tax=Fundulus heteroclitus TaxID=8078 RepID=UPI00165A4ECC|nr:uncharacterized protein LOC105923477 [Fundulus heteroclitus]